MSCLPIGNSRARARSPTSLSKPIKFLGLKYPTVSPESDEGVGWLRGKGNSKAM